MIYLWPSPDMVSCQGQWTLHPWPPFSLCTSGHSVEHSDHAGVLGNKCRLHRLPLYIPSTEDKIVNRLSVHSIAPVIHCFLIYCCNWSVKHFSSYNKLAWQTSPHPLGILVFFMCTIHSSNTNILKLLLIYIQ